MANKPRQPDSNYPLTRAAPARRISRRHPAFAGRPKGFYYPDLVGVVPNYAPTEEIWQMRRDRSRIQLAALRASGVVVSRAGVPDGWAGDRGRILRAQVEAGPRAKELFKMLVEKDLIKEIEDPKVVRAFQVALEIMDAQDEETKKPLHTAKDRLAAARLCADFYKGKPASKIEASVTKAEDFLAVLAAGAAKES